MQNCLFYVKWRSTWLFLVALWGGFQVLASQTYAEDNHDGEVKVLEEIIEQYSSRDAQQAKRDATDIELQIQLARQLQRKIDALTEKWGVFTAEDRDFARKDDAEKQKRREANEAERERLRARFANDPKASETLTRLEMQDIMENFPSEKAIAIKRFDAWTQDKEEVLANIHRLAQGRKLEQTERLLKELGDINNEEVSANRVPSTTTTASEVSHVSGVFTPVDVSERPAKWTDAEIALQEDYRRQIQGPSRYEATPRRPDPPYEDAARAEPPTSGAGNSVIVYGLCILAVICYLVARLSALRKSTTSTTDESATIKNISTSVKL